MLEHFIKKLLDNSITLGNKFLFISFFLVFLDVFGVADADFGVSFRVVSTVSKIFAKIEVSSIPNNHTTLV